ncbi:hypothetical protein JOQ06_009968 [Pogonophryne albipinna]|uniref:Uncharacterized protein n=1 Tax=Pogonophryne albipinna TaxID=1090488 RepID=A0AAD6FVR8_9TELE|nr:hypothetical protein JOQ06_009968 [Pogonophryne albipinna]
MKELLCWCQSQMPSTTSALLRLQSPLTRSGRGPADLQVAPLAGKVCQWSCPGSVNGAGCSWKLAPQEPKIGRGAGARSSPASQLSVPQAEIKVPALADPPGLRHSLAPAAAEQEQPQHALLRLGNEAERFMGWMCH